MKQLKQLKESPEKKSEASTGFGYPWLARYRCDAQPTDLWSRYIFLGCLYNCFSCFITVRITFTFSIRNAYLWSECKNNFDISWYLIIRSGSTEDPSRKVCRFYLTKSGCWRGETCPDIHAKKGEFFKYARHHTYWKQHLVSDRALFSSNNRPQSQSCAVAKIIFYLPVQAASCTTSIRTVLFWYSHNCTLVSGTVFHSLCQVWLSSIPPEIFTFSYCAWLWNWAILLLN